MSNDLRAQALSAWRKLFSISVNLAGAEDHYQELVMAADRMEQQGLISSDEWRKLVQQAGTLFASRVWRAGGGDEQ